MSLVSDMERKVCAMPKGFRDWFAEYYHAVCSGEGRSLSDDEVQVAIDTWTAAKSDIALPISEQPVGLSAEAFGHLSEQVDSADMPFVTVRRSFLREAITPITCRKRESGWQPIETAPKDGTSFIGRYKYDVRMVKWIPAWNKFDVLHSYATQQVEQPSGWIPLPATQIEAENGRRR